MGPGIRLATHIFCLHLLPSALHHTPLGTFVKGKLTICISFKLLVEKCKCHLSIFHCPEELSQRMTAVITFLHLCTFLCALPLPSHPLCLITLSIFCVDNAIRHIICPQQEEKRRKEISFKLMAPCCIHNWKSSETILQLLITKPSFSLTNRHTQNWHKLWKQCA